MDYPDTLINLITVSRYGTGGGSFQYNSTAFSSVEAYFQAVDRNDEFTKKILEDIKYGCSIPTDTIVAKMELEILPKNMTAFSSNPHKVWKIDTSDSTSSKYPFLVSKPRNVTGQLIFKPKNPENYRWVVVFNWLKYFFTLTTALLVVWQIGCLLHNFRRERIFYAANFRRLLWLGMGFMAFGMLKLLETALFYWINSDIHTAFYSLSRWHVGNENLKETLRLGQHQQLDLDFFSSPFILGLFLIVLAEVFRKGFELQQEQDLTI